MKGIIKILSPVATMLLLFSVTGCITLKKVALYDTEQKVEIAKAPTSIKDFVEPVIYEDDASDAWGLEDDGCIDAGVSTDIKNSGTSSLRISWDRGPEACDWIGMGIGWDNWVGKDLSEIYNHAAIRMHVRTEKGKMFGLPIVLTLEDYSAVQSYAYAGAGYLSKPFVDEEWQAVTVPLTAFDIEKDGIDLMNVKQLLFELQAAGSIYMDDISLVLYKPVPQKPWLVEEELPDPTTLPQVLYDDQFANNNGWGIVKGNCQDFRNTQDAAAKGSSALHLKWDESGENCGLKTFGVNWNKWKPIDITEIMTTAALEFYIKTASEIADELPIHVQFGAYDGGGMISVKLSGGYTDGGAYTSDWQKVSIPFSAFEGKANLTRIQHLLFQMKGEGEVYIDEIRIVQN